jgi:cystathionine gamma-lyase
MADELDARIARLAHLRGKDLVKGEPVPLPLVMASIFHLPGDPAGFAQYGRGDNPTWEAAEAALGVLEDAPCVAFPSGMGAISAVFMALLKAGDRILLPADGYYTTRYFTDRVLARFGVHADKRPTASFAEGGFEGYRLVYVESPANPSLDLCDIAAIASAAHAAGAVVVADNTTMTPLGQRPLDLGVDVVVAADTKAPNGHSDVLFGHVASRDTDIVAAVKEWRKLSGAIPGPFEAWQLHRGLATLELRFDRMCSSAGTIAERMRGHAALERLRYPGLADDPGHALATRQMLRFGSLIGLTFAGEAQADAFIDGCRLIEPATSFGGLHTTAERRARWGDAVPPGFVRLSIGCEPMEELWSALNESLDAVARP